MRVIFDDIVRGPTTVLIGDEVTLQNINKVLSDESVELVGDQELIIHIVRRNTK